MDNAAPKAALDDVVLDHNGGAASAEHARRQLLRVELLGMAMLGGAWLQRMLGSS
jgi:hypothetical protein